jgi:hypothetical protein
MLPYTTGPLTTVLHALNKPRSEKFRFLSQMFKVVTTAQILGMNSSTRGH